MHACCISFAERMGREGIPRVSTQISGFRTAHDHGLANGRCAMVREEEHVQFTSDQRARKMRLRDYFLHFFFALFAGTRADDACGPPHCASEPSEMTWLAQLRRVYQVIGINTGGRRLFESEHSFPIPRDFNLKKHTTTLTIYTEAMSKPSAPPSDAPDIPPRLRPCTATARVCYTGMTSAMQGAGRAE